MCENLNPDKIHEEVLKKPSFTEATMDEDDAFNDEGPPDFKYEDQSSRYLILDSDKGDFYNRQYFHYYRMREAHLHTRVLENGRAIYDKKLFDVTLSQVNQGEKCFVIGALIKRMQNRMAVLKDLEDEDVDELEVAVAEDELETLALDTDFLEFEDSQKQCVTLKGNLDHYKLVTGMIVGIYGVQISDNVFDVERIVLPSLPSYIERTLLEEDIFVIMVSGFNVDNPCSDLLAELTYFTNVLQTRKYFNKVARLVFAGNHAITFCQCENCRTTSINNVMPIGLSLDADKEECTLKVMNHFRRRFPQIDVDVMPGEGDPCSLFMPQQPMNKALYEEYDLPSSSEGECQPSDKRTVNPVTNPYAFKVMGVSVLGTSGQNVNAFRKLTNKGKSTMEIMKDIIESGIIVPTAPDFTDCFPFNRNVEKDPLVMDELPHIFFAGNQKEYATQLVDLGDNRKVCLVSVPEFKDTHSMIAVNLRTLECSRIVSQNHPPAISRFETESMDSQ